MARGWGRSEEDLPADKEQAAAEKNRAAAIPADDPKRARERRLIELSLSQIEQDLALNPPEARRKALEAARAELRAKLKLS